jgi:SAM-dependent methyltransferase
VASTSSAAPTGRAFARRASRAEFPDWRFAPNIGGHPASYELENEAVDRAGHVLASMRRLAPWDGKTIVDLGCGTGYWLPKYAPDAARVIGIEPDPALRSAAQRRAASLHLPEWAGGAGCGQQCPAKGSEVTLVAPVRSAVDVLAGSAERIPLDDDSVDVVHARFAYFFPPGADAGLAEVMRVLRPGGQIVMVDNDYRWGEFARLLTASATRPPAETARAVDTWWRERGADRHEVRSELQFARRADLAAVLHIELPHAIAAGWLRQHPARTSLSYGYVLFAVTAPGLRTS